MRRPGVRFVAATIVLSAFAGCGGMSSDSAPSPTLCPTDPPVGKALVGLEFFEGWSQPRARGVPVNTSGWEDSSFISPDGSILFFGYTRSSVTHGLHTFFGYTRLNYLALTQQGRAVVDGPDRPGQHGAAFDIYEARVQRGAWVVTNSSVNSSDADLHEAAVGVDGVPSLMAFVRFDPEGDIYLAERRGTAWVNVRKLPAPINTRCVEDNPHLSPDARFLYFDSNRADAGAASCRTEAGGPQRDIYRTERRDSAWSAPQPLAGAPNQTEVRWQVFVEGNGDRVYWSGRAADCSPGVSCLYRAQRQTDGSYAERTLIARATSPAHAASGDVVAIGEASLTSDGRLLYFTYIEQLAGAGVDLSLGVTRRP